LKIVKKRLDKANIPYMVSGGIAVSFWGFPRTTHDIDIVIEAQEKDKNKIIADADCSDTFDTFCIRSDAMHL